MSEFVLPDEALRLLSGAAQSGIRQSVAFLDYHSRASQYNSIKKVSVRILHILGKVFLNLNSQTMKPSYLLLILFVITGLQQAFSQTQGKTGSISDVRFIEGSWRATAADRSIDAVWSQPAGDNIVGYVRVMKEGTVVLYELFAFEQSPEGFMAIVRHFDPGLVAREEKEKPDRYNFLEAGDGWALFEKQGDAVRVRYERRSADAFAIVVGRQQEGAWVFKDFWKFDRVK